MGCHRSNSGRPPAAHTVCLRGMRLSRSRSLPAGYTPLHQTTWEFCLWKPERATKQPLHPPPSSPLPLSFFFHLKTKTKELKSLSVTQQSQLNKTPFHEHNQTLAECTQESGPCICLSCLKKLKRGGRLSYTPSQLPANVSDDYKTQRPREQQPLC